MIIVLFAGIIPAIFLVQFGKSRRPSPDRPESVPGWAGFLAIGLGLLMGTALLAFTLLGDMGSLVALLLLPSICALVAESGLYLFTILARLISGQARPYLRWPAGLLLLVPLMLAALGFLKDPFILQVVLFGGALLASGWLIWNRLGRWLALSYVPLLLLSFVAVWAIDTQNEFPFLPAYLALIARSLIWLVPGLSIIFSGRLVGWVLANEPGSRSRRLFLAGLLAAPIFLLMAWQAATASAWDVATDGVGGVFMLELAFVFGVATAIHQSWSLPPKRNAFMFGFVVLILAIIMGANSFGIFGFDGAWGNVPHARTARRAAVINKAILRYAEQKGQYPQTLGDLTPNYLVYLPTPFIIPHQTWCYEGGQEYYRFGYVYRDYFSTPASMKVFAAAGQPPHASWPCEAEAAKYPAPPGYYNP